MKFTKMHGCGNDYVYVDLFQEKIDDFSATAIRLSDRHFGIGSDGMILIAPSKTADFQMIMYNADGSRGQMCGNGIRCVAKYVYDHGMTDQTTITIETGAGIKTLDLTAEDGKMKTARVDMGEPILNAAEIPVIAAGSHADGNGSAISGGSAPAASDTGSDPAGEIRVIDEPFVVGGEIYRLTCVSMGNPHAVAFMDDVASLNLEAIGPSFENHPRFPERINTEFIRVIDRQNIEMRVWERGSGETLACGTGSCASVAACVLNGLTDRKVNVHLLGGMLEIFWNETDNHVYMTGPAATVFEGEIEI